MSLEHARQLLYRTLLFSGICGFEIAAGLTTLADVLSTPASIAVRLFVATCALIAIFSDFGKVIQGSRRLILGFCVFWYLYIFRIAYATTFSTEQLLFPVWYYYSWAIGACALPMLGLSLWSPRQEDADRNFLILFAALAFGGLLASFGATSLEFTQGNERVETGRLQLVALNPILLGQLGATLFLMSAWVIVTRYDRYRLSVKILFLAFAVLGGVLLIGSNSRGPLVSVAVCLLFIAIASSRRSRLYAAVICLVAIVGFVPSAQYLESEFGFSTYTRLFGQSQLFEENTLDRIGRYAGAMRAFMDSPFWGSSLEESIHGGYPHNIFIEALMATGIFGGMLLLMLMSVTFIYAARVYVNVQGYGWASVLFVQYFMAAQFSGSIYTVNYLWITAGLVIAIHASCVPNKRNQVPKHFSEKKMQPSRAESVKPASELGGV